MTEAGKPGVTGSQPHGMVGIPQGLAGSQEMGQRAPFFPFLSKNSRELGWTQRTFSLPPLTLHGDKLSQNEGQWLWAQPQGSFSLLNPVPWLPSSTSPRAPLLTPGCKHPLARGAAWVQPLETVAGSLWTSLSPAMQRMCLKPRLLPLPSCCPVIPWLPGEDSGALSSAGSLG